MAIANLPTFDQLQSGLEPIRQAPRGAGRVEAIVRRPAVGEREVVEQATLDPVQGLIGDNWLARGCRLTDDGAAHPGMQLTLMNARAIALIARTKDRWPLAGDQFYVDFDLSDANLPAGTRLEIGGAMVEVTAEPHLGCKQFAARFGTDAVKFVNSPVGKQLRLRGVNAKIVRGGIVRVGDAVRKL